MSDKPVRQRRRPRTVSIASGAHIPQIDLETLFRNREYTDSLSGGSEAKREGAAMTGGGAQTPVGTTPITAVDKPQRARTIALADGTRITFAAAD